MTDITKAEINILVQLQKAETETVKIESYLQGVEKEKSLLEAQLNQFKESIIKLQNEFNAVNKTCIDAEVEIKVNDERIEKSSENLKRVSSKDYAVLLREIDNNKKRRDTLENQYLKLLEEKEEKEKDLKEKEMMLEQLIEKIRAEQHDIDNKSEADRERLKEHIDQKQKTAQNLKPAILRLFNEVSQTSGGLAIAEVQNEVCRGCFMNIPPQLYIEIQRCNLLIQCPHCNRILYHIDAVAD